MKNSLTPCLLGKFACFLLSADFYAPTMIMAGALSVTPVRPSLRTYVLYVHMYVITYVCPDDVHSLTRIFFIRIL